MQVGTLFFELLDIKSIDVVAGGSNMMAEMGKKADALKAAGMKPYIIPGGASNAIGAMGYAVCAEGIMERLNDMRLPIDHIVVPSGSAGPHAGMVVGMTGVTGMMPRFSRWKSFRWQKKKPANTNLSSSRELQS